MRDDDGCRRSEPSLIRPQRAGGILPLDSPPAEPAVWFVFFFDLLILSHKHANLITLKAGGKTYGIKGTGGLCTRGTAPLLSIHILLDQEIQGGQPRLDVNAALSEPSEVASLSIAPLHAPQYLSPQHLHPCPRMT